MAQPIPDITTFFADNPLINASGCNCSTKGMLDILFKSAAGSVITKSATLAPRNGNPEPRYWAHPDGNLTINSMGLPNCGIQYYLDYFKRLDTSTNKYEHARFISLAGMTLEENLQMLDMIFNIETQYYMYIDVIELNLSCPNLIGHRQLAYDFPELETYLSKFIIHYNKLYKATNRHYPIYFGIKLPPYFEFWQFDAIVDILSRLPDNYLKFVHTINSVPNGLVIDIDTEATVIRPKDGFGGLGGAIIKPIALANVRGLYTRFKAAKLEILIIGSGGVASGEDVFEFILAGASMVSIGSQLMIEGAGCFTRILSELTALMEKKGYANLDAFRGKLKNV